MRRNSVLAGLVSAYLLVLPTMSEARPMTIDDMFKFQRVAEPDISPDGKQVAYQVTSIIDVDANKSTTSIWVAATDGKTPPRQLTNPNGKSDKRPRWSPDGKKLLFESNRSGSYQLWVLDMQQPGEAKQITNISTGANAGVWSRDGRLIAFTSTVYPEYSKLPFNESDKKNKEREEAAEKNPVKAKVFRKLFFRHWDSYVDDKRQHLFVITADGRDCRDVTPGDRDAYPTSSTFSSSVDFCFSPDSKFLVFSAVPEKDEAWSTDYQICRVSIDNTSEQWETLSKDNKAADSGPQFSRDGKQIAWRAQKKPGYEADKWDIVVADCNPNGTLNGALKNISEKHDLSVSEFVWSANGEIVFTAETKATTRLFQIRLDGTLREGIHHTAGKMGGASINHQEGHVSAVSGSANGNVWSYVIAFLDRPAEVYTTIFDPFEAGVRSNSQIISRANDALLKELTRNRPEYVEVPVEGGVKMQMWILKPPGFDATKKWPVVYLIHGGPQGAWEDSWSYRWNPTLWAAQGYVVVLPNPRGSTGFGQKFCDEISGDWGGKCYRDLVAGLDYVDKLPYVDKNRYATAGASFGGYMQNWFAVNDIARRFKCQINHCSVWNFESMWGTTEELWFDEYEHGGLPWEIPGKYREFSPHTKAGNLGKNKVPMLIIHNDLDFRCPIGQGHELFTALQRQGVPSRFINFPDEGHWVTKPANSRFWHQEVFNWLKKYAEPGGK